MDEDHSRIHNTNDGSSLLGVPWENATAADAGTPSRSPPPPSSSLGGDASPPRAVGGVVSRDRGWSGGVDPGYFADVRQASSSSFNDSNDPGAFPPASPGGGLPGGGRGERGGMGFGGGVAAAAAGGSGEMSCVDSVDLGDVLDVRQEETAPEQVSFISSTVHCRASCWML